MLATFQGVAKGVPTASQEFGVVPTGADARYQPGTAATLGGLLTGVGALLAGAKGK
jgi:hypothetical protein